MMYTHFKTPFLALENYELDINVVRLLPHHLAEQHQMIAIDKLGDILTVGITNLEDKYILPFLEQQLNCKIIPFQISLESWLEIFPTAYLDKEKSVNYVG